AEDGIRDLTVTGVQTCALPICAAETPDEIAAKKAGGSGWFAGNPKDFDRGHALDVPQLFQFLLATQPDALKKLAIADYTDVKDRSEERRVGKEWKREKER